MEASHCGSESNVNYIIWDWPSGPSGYSVIGDAAHSYHTHFHATDPPASDSLTRDIQWAEDDLWGAQWTPVGRDRHRAVKAARDNLRRLRKLEVKRIDGKQAI